MNTKMSFFGDCTFPNSLTNPPRDYFLIDAYGEHYCESCRCITSVDQTQQKGPSCHNLTCVDGGLMIKIASIWHDCGENGEIIKVTTIDSRTLTYMCPNNSVDFCALNPQIPTYDSWISFIDINPTSGTIGTSVTIRVSGITADDLNGGSTMVLFGDQDLTQSDSIGLICDNTTYVFTTISSSAASITCTIAQPPGSFPFQPQNYNKNNGIDVIVVDQYGRTAVGTDAFVVSSATSITSSLCIFIICISFLL